MDRIDSFNAVDLGGGKMGFQDQILSSGSGSQEGTWVTADWLNGVQEEPMTVIEAAGLVGDKTKKDLLAKAIQTGKLNFAVAGGTANALTATLPIVPSAFAQGAPIALYVGAANTGAMTINGVALKRSDGAAMQAGDIPGPCFIDIRFDSANWRMMRLVASEIAGLIKTAKSPFNVQFTPYATRTSLSGTGFVDLVVGSYTKQSATSAVRVAVTTNLYSAGGAAGGQLKTSVGAQSFIVVGENMTSGANKASFNGASLFYGLSAGSLSWKLQLGRSDGSAWTSVVNPNSSDSANLPTATTTSVEIWEVEL